MFQKWMFKETIPILGLFKENIISMLNKKIRGIIVRRMIKCLLFK